MRLQPLFAALAVITLLGAQTAFAQDATAPSPPQVIHLSDGPRRVPSETARAKTEEEKKAALEEANEQAADDWEPGKPVPPGYRIAHPVQLGLIIPGAVCLGISYILAGALSDHENLPVLLVPLAGPFLAVPNDHARASIGAPALVAIGLGEVIGAGMVIGGFVRRRTTLDEVDDDEVSRLGPTLTVGPMLAKRAQGLQVVGRF